MLCCVLTETPCVYVAVDNRLTFVCEPFTAISVAIPPEFPWSLTLHPVSMCWTALDQCPAPATRVDVRSVWDSVVGYSSVWGKRSLEVFAGVLDYVITLRWLLFGNKGNYLCIEWQTDSAAIVNLFWDYKRDFDKSSRGLFKKSVCDLFVLNFPTLVKSVYGDG